MRSRRNSATGNGKGLRGRSLRVAIPALAALATAFAASPTLAVPPAAGSVIGNQATATFTAGGQTFSVTSNLVTTTVNQVAGVDIEAAQTKQAVIGGKVFFPHTITNTGNGSDNFNLIALDTLALDVVAIYADADCNGVPDALTGITQTGTLAAGASACVVVEVNVTPLATGTPSITVTAVSTRTGTVTDSNVDTVTLTVGEVLGITKQMVLINDVDLSGSVTPGDLVRVRLTYNNTGGLAASAVVVTDPLPSQLTYLPGSGAWSDGGTMTDATGNTDGTNGLGQTIAYSSTGNTVTATISSVPSGRTGFIEFTATIAAGASGTVTNTGTIQSTATVSPVASNLARITVNPGAVIAVTLADTDPANKTLAGAPASDLPDGNYVAGAPTSTTDQDGVANDTIAYTTTNFPLGAVVPFNVVITNHASTPQRFDLSSVAGNFPAGTAFQFVSLLGGTILDTNGNSQPDILVLGQTSLHFTVNAYLPATATRVSTDPAWVATIRATSAVNSSITNQTRLSMANNVIGTVDLQNAPGVGAAVPGNPNADLNNAGAPWTTLTTTPGVPVDFTLTVVNSQIFADTFLLQANGANALLAPLPAGWTVVFRTAPNGGGSIIVGTGTLAAGATGTYYARVTPPAGIQPGTTNLYFRAVSALNATVSDVKMDAVSISSTDIAITPDRIGQAAPGGTVVFTHTLANVGSTTVNAGAIGYSPAYPTFNGQLYVDTNGNGVLDLGTDQPISNISGILPYLGDNSFDAGDSITIFSRVQVPSSASANLAEAAAIVVTVAGDSNTANNTATENVVVVAGNVVVGKLQALDNNCDGTPESLFVPTLLQANPGACLIYRITASNLGTLEATGLRIDDATPAYTTYQAGTGVPTGGSAPVMVAQPGAGDTGAVSATFGTVVPGGAAVLTFRVKVDE